MTTGLLGDSFIVRPAAFFWRYPLFSASAIRTAWLCSGSRAPKRSVSVPCSFSSFFNSAIDSFFLLQLRLVLLLEVGPLHCFMVEGCAERVAWRYIFHPHINLGRLLFHSSWPQAIDQHTVAIFGISLFEHALDPDHFPLTAGALRPRHESFRWC